MAPAPTACKRAARCHDSPSSRFQSEVVVAGYQGVPIGVLMQILQAQHVLQASYHSNDMPCSHEIGCRIQPFARAMEIATAAIMFEEVPRFAHEGAMRAYYLLATVPARVWQGPHAPIRTRARHARTRARALPWRLRREVTRDTFGDGILTETSPSNTPKRENTLNTT